MLRTLLLLTLIDEYARECLTIDVGRQLNSEILNTLLKAKVLIGRARVEYNSVRQNSSLD